MCVQNHPEVQQWALEGGCLPPLLALCDASNPACLNKAVLALGCLVRNHPSAEQAFRAQGGGPTLCQLAASPHHTVATKAMRLLAWICRPQDAAGLLDVGVLPVALKAVQQEEEELTQLREAALTLLTALASATPLTQCDQAVELRSVVTARLAGARAASGACGFLSLSTDS
jgi:hypothetical protein